MREPKINNPIRYSSISTIIMFGVMIVFILATAMLLSGGLEIKIMVLLLGIISSAICFFNTEMALYLILFAMLFSPEFSLGEGLAEGRSLVIRIEDIIIVIVFISWVLKTTIYRGIGLIEKTPLNRPIAIYIAVSLFSTLLGALLGNVGLSSGLLYVFKYTEYFLVFFLFISNINERDQIRRFIIFAFIVAVFIALYAIIQIPQGVRVTAPFEGESGEPNTLGGYLILIISVAVGLLMNISDQRAKRFLIALIALFIFPFVFTLSRSSYVAAIPMFALMFYFSKRKLLIAAMLLVFLVLSPIIVPESVKGRVTETFIPNPAYSDTETIMGQGLDPSTSARITSFKRALLEWRKKPIFGWGITGIGLIDSMYFRILAETGLVGLTAFLFLMYKVIVFLYSIFKRTEDELLKGLSFGMLMATAAMLGHSIGAATFIIVRIMEPYWFFMATIFVLSEIEKGEREALIEENK